MCCSITARFHSAYCVPARPCLKITTAITYETNSNNIRCTTCFRRVTERKNVAADFARVRSPQSSTVQQPVSH